MSNVHYGPSVSTTTLCGEGRCPPSRVTCVGLPCPNTISGVIRDFRTGEPVKDITVWVENFENGSYGETLTDDEGRYRVGSLEPGPGYVLTVSGLGFSHRLFENGVLPIEGLQHNIELVRAGFVTGLVKSSGGQPLPKAVVYIAQQDTPTWGGKSTSTNEEGKFCLHDLSVNWSQDTDSSTYSVVVGHPSYSAVENSCQVKPYYFEEDKVDLEFTLPERASIHGSVTVQGIPLAGAKAYLWESLEGLLLDTDTVFTDGYGQFSLNVNAPNTYNIVIQGYGTSLVLDQITVVPGQTSEISADLDPPSTIKGVVIDTSNSPVVGAMVELLTPIGSGPVSGEILITGSDGKYEITDVQPNVEWIVRATMPNAQIYGSSFFDKSINVAPNTTNILDVEGDIVNPQCSLSVTHLGSDAYNATVQSSDNQGIKIVSLMINGNIVDSVSFEGEITTSENVVFDINLGNEVYSLVAEVYDVSGNLFISDEVVIGDSN